MDSKADKLYKKAVRDRQKRIRPGECQKYIRLVLDSQILSSSYGREFIAELNATSKISYEIKTLPVRECIIWERNSGQVILKPDQTNGLHDAWQQEDQIIKILTHEELLQIIKSKTLANFAENFLTFYKNMQHIVLYLRGGEKLKTMLSSTLLELQIMYQLNIFQVGPTTKELASTVMRLSKAIAEIPFKKQKSEVLDTFKKFLDNDKKQCVRVEGTNGLGRLWQQHLNRLPLVTLEVAETIIDKYPCPKKLLQDFKNNTEAVEEIANLRIRRSGPIPLQTHRRIGNVLANKLFTLYNARDPTINI